MNVFIIAAITADGFIGKDSGHTADWTSKEDKQLFVRLTKEAGVMIMGSKTFDTIGRGLPGRKTIVYTSTPEKYKNISNVEATNESPVDLISRLDSEGHTSVAICGGAQIYTLFMSEKLVNELYLTIEPVIFSSGISLFGGDQSYSLELIEKNQLNSNSVLLHYKVLN